MRIDILSAIDINLVSVKTLRKQRINYVGNTCVIVVFYKKYS